VLFQKPRCATATFNVSADAYELTKAAPAAASNATILTIVSSRRRLPRSIEGTVAPAFAGRQMTRTAHSRGLNTWAENAGLKNARLKMLG
jgi:hypothetical protein